MTPEELQLLRAISDREVSTFIPGGTGPGPAQRFDRLVDKLQTMERLGWIELKVSVRRSAPGGTKSKYVGAAARCTAEGRRVLRFLSEGGS